MAGFVNSTFTAIVEGIVQSVQEAEDNLAPAALALGEADVEEGGYNRSPTSYMLNPEEEREMYEHDHERTMTVLRIDHATAPGVVQPVGMFSWFPVHPTNMNSSNVLVSADNKGHASQLFEAWAGTEAAGQKPTAGGFVAAFAQAHQGDISPNVAGALCRAGPAEGRECDPFWSTVRGSTSAALRHCS